MGSILLGQNTWLETMKKWIETAVSIWEIAKSDDLAAKKSLYVEIFGLNLKMENKKVGLAAEQFQISPLKPHWQALRAAREKTAPEGGNFPKSPILEGSPGLEPGTPCLKGRCSNQLSYEPIDKMQTSHHSVML